MEEVKYRFAKDENGNLVDANEFDPSERSSRKCYCISCGEVLIPVLGKIRKRCVTENHICTSWEKEC